MKKIFLSLLTLATITAAGGFSIAQSLSATAEEPLAERLLTPSSYEEYLSLNAPVDVAVTDRYTAIADGNILYLFNRDTNAWQAYAHPQPITQIGFGERDKLYFLDDTTALYLLNVTSPQSATDTGVHCSTFTIAGGILYFVNTSGAQNAIRQAPLNNLSQAIDLYTSRVYSPDLAYYNENLYFLYGADYLYRLSLDTKRETEVTKLKGSAVSLSISEGNLYYTTEEGAFYGYDLTQLAESGDAPPLFSYEDEVGYSAQSAQGKDVYLVRGNTVRKHSDGEFTDYEIGSASDGDNRLNGASEIFLSGNSLFFADDGNERILAYDGKTEDFKQFSSSISTPYLTGYGNTLLAANASQATLYSTGEEYGKPLTTLDGATVSGEIIGATCVYGNYYVVTNNNYCYTPVFEQGEYRWTEIHRKAHSVEKLASDAHGFLYVLHGDGVYRYTEETFNGSTEEGEKLVDGLPSTTTKIAVDYQGNLYALADNTLHRYFQDENGKYTQTQTEEFSTPFVYGVTPKAISFAFGIEENQAYILYEGNYATVTTALNLPTVQQIPTETVSEEIFGDAPAAFSVVKTAPKTLFIEIDLNATQGASVFPYLGAQRVNEAQTSLKIAETAEYFLLVRRESAADPYRAYLVRKENCQTVENYQIKYDTEKTGYLSNATSLYRYPSLGLPALDPLPRRTEVTLLGEINGIDGEYFVVRHGEKIGYVTKSHVSEFDGAPPVTQTESLGDAKDDAGAIWRLAYLLLGSVAICILIDYLILRKRNEE